MAAVSLAAWLAAPPAGALAQATAALEGEVVADSTFAPLAGAEVSIAELALRVRAGDDGRFRIEGIAPGTYTVEARMIGWAPMETRLAFAAGARVQRDFLMVRRATAAELPGVVVRDTADRWRSPNLAAFDERRKLGHGHFLDTETLEREPLGRPMSNVLRRIPGLKVVRIQGGYALASSRGAESLHLLGGRPGRDPRECYVQVYLDGTRIAYNKPGEKPMDIDQFRTGVFAAVEYYPGGATVPPQYNAPGASCGTLLLWTR